MSVVIDASALLAVLLQENGSDTVVPLMRGAHMSALNASECFARVVDKEVPAHHAMSMLKKFEINIAAFDLSDAVAVADLRSKTKSVGASLGDRACLHLAARLGLPLLTGDRRLAELDLGIDIRLIR
jgi:PIN domain nuclease of toxin-antitoxin system